MFFPKAFLWICNGCKDGDPSSHGKAMRINITSVRSPFWKKSIRCICYADRTHEWKNAVPHVYPAEGIVAAYKVRGYPAYYLIGPEGQVVLGPEHQVRLRGERLLETLAWALEQH